MSKEKLSAEALYPVWFEKHGRELIVDCLYPFAEWYAKQVTEQLQREREEMRKALEGMTKAWACLPMVNKKALCYTEAKKLLTPKPEKQ